ncbi:Ecto-NOX disulfide-thiol exchanger 1 [Varanus komodoensis]|nr:Ecto-NOX disulfide-thiol exchanger 1 [Varanus komodoensis]
MAKGGLALGACEEPALEVGIRRIPRLASQGLSPLLHVCEPSVPGVQNVLVPAPIRNRARANRLSVCLLLVVGPEWIGLKGKVKLQDPWTASPWGVLITEWPSMPPNSICVRSFDPSLGMMAGITPLNPMLPGMGLVPQLSATDVPVTKEIIHCKSGTLFPPNPNLPPPSTRERPPGCKTVFVGGLPENATEEIIQEVFEQCGDITAIRKSKKNFCHIRFAEEFMVDKAIYLSGYRMRLGSSTDKKDSGRLHVDFAQARDDFYEWECKQRMLAREERHRRKMEEDRMRPPSPPAIMHYSEHEATLLAEKLKGVLDEGGHVVDRGLVSLPHRFRLVGPLPTKFIQLSFSEVCSMKCESEEGGPPGCRRLHRLST